MLARLGVAAEPVATQVVARDRHAQLVCTMAVAASSLDRLATELRHLQRTEVREAEEAFTPGQKGSSAMPHKRNPITAERISGIARVVRGHSVAALEDVALWHERDISHSSVERIILPDAFLALDYMLARARTLVEGLVVHPERMREVLESSHGLVYSQRVLLGLVEAGLSREDAYALVQRNALRAWDEGRPLGELLAADPDVTESSRRRGAGGAARPRLVHPARARGHGEGRRPVTRAAADYPLVLEGKVREVRRVDAERLLIVATDRISAYDWIMPTPIPDKGRVLTALSALWFDRTRPTSSPTT